RDNSETTMLLNGLRPRGVTQVRAIGEVKMPKSQIYLKTLPLWTRHLVSIPDDNASSAIYVCSNGAHRARARTRLITDDYANALAGMLVECSAKRGYDTSLRWVSGDIEESNRQWRRLQYWSQFPELW